MPNRGPSFLKQASTGSCLLALVPPPRRCPENVAPTFRPGQTQQRRTRRAALQLAATVHAEQFTARFVSRAQGAPGFFVSVHFRRV